MEQAVIDRLQEAFLESKILQQHVTFLFNKGSIYKCYNNNLLFHGCMPLNEDGTFMSINTGKGYFGPDEDPQKERCIDFFWFLWCGYKSPLFGKKKITTFERCFIEDQSTWKEAKNPYYTLMDQVEVVENIVAEFGLDRHTAHIINGHMPVNKGSNPVHANGRAFVIDGGFAKAYQKKTGIGGYSLIYRSQGFVLAAHEPFISKEKAIQEETDIISTAVATENANDRILNKDTDLGKELGKKVASLQKLLEAYRSGLIAQRR